MEDLEKKFLKIFYPKLFNGRKNKPFSDSDILRFFEKNLSVLDQNQVIEYFIHHYCEAEHTLEPEPVPLPELPSPIIYFPRYTPMPIYLPAPEPKVIAPPTKLLPPPGMWWFIIPKFLPPYFLNLLKKHMDLLVTSEAHAFEALVEKKPPRTYIVPRETMYKDMKGQIETLEKQVYALEVANLESKWQINKLQARIEKLKDALKYPLETQEYLLEDLQQEIEEEIAEKEEIEEEEERIFDIESLSYDRAMYYLDENCDYELIEHFTEFEYDIEITDVNWGIGWYNMRFEKIPAIVGEWVRLQEIYLKALGEIIDEFQEI